MQIKKIFWRDLSGHDGVMDVVRAKKFQEPIQLADAHPIDQIHMLRQGWIGFTSERRRDDFLNASLSR